MSAEVLDRPEITTLSEERIEEDFPWQVIIFNDEAHTFDEVIFQIQKATGAALQAAFEITMEIHTQGKAICFEGSLTQCERVANILREISLSVEIVPAGE
ncbi:MAG: ATP-dependent Clp protease adaptor ClpS [Nitrospiria bacterium]